MERFFYLILVAMCMACQPENITCGPETKVDKGKNEEMTEPIAEKEEKNSGNCTDSVHELIYALHLENQFPDWMKTGNSFTRDIQSRVKFLNAGKHPVPAVLVEVPGGTGGNDIYIFRRRENAYENVGYYFAWLDKVDGETSNGMKDIILTHRQRKQGYEYIDVRYKWDGNKYSAREIVNVQQYPFKLLKCIGLAHNNTIAPEPERCPEILKSELFCSPYDYDLLILEIDTLESRDNDKYLLLVRRKAKQCFGDLWLVEHDQDKNRYQLLKKFSDDHTFQKTH